MSQIAFLNGEWIPAEALVIPATDAGFMQGVTVAEQMRTFRGVLFRLDDHLDRLARSLAIVGIDPPWERDDLAEIARELTERNQRGMAAGDDLGLSMFVTPGPYSTFAPGGGAPLVGMHSYPLPFQLWAARYVEGQRVIVTSVRQVPANCWPTELKCRSRMHYYLADREARQREPGARALLLDQRGFVTEASTANLVIWIPGEGLVAPPDDSILPGVSVSVLRELATNLELPFVTRPVTVADLEQATEAYLTSTSPCVLPMTHCDGRPIGSGKPGPIFANLLDAWSQHVGVDIGEQARRFANRRASS